MNFCFLCLVCLFNMLFVCLPMKICFFFNNLFEMLFLTENPYCGWFVAKPSFWLTLFSICSVFEFDTRNEIARFFTPRGHNGLDIWQIVSIFNQTRMELQSNTTGFSDCRIFGHGLSHANRIEYRNWATGFSGKPLYNMLRLPFLFK